MKKQNLRRKRLSLAVALAFSAGTMQAQAQTPPLPADGQVTAGAGTVSQTSATSLLVKQTTDRMAMTWRSFDIRAGHSVQFDQPSASSIALNRVTGGSRSEIYGSLSANGQVFLVNPNGILFGKGAQVDVGGLVASTLNITDRDFLEGKYVFSDPSSKGVVLNEGMLRAGDGGYLALIGNKAVNNGTMLAHLGSVALGAGGAVQLTLADSKLIKFQVTEGALDALAGNGGLIRANGGQVILTAGARDSLLASAVNNTGVIEARTVERQAGNILLLAGMEAGTTHVGGTLDASAPNGGDGGFIETSGAHVKVEKGLAVTTKAPQGKTGKWLIDPQDFTIGGSGSDDISGTDLTAALGSSNVEIQSSSGGAAGNGDINVNDDVSWTANTLTLTAARDINFISASLNVSGTGTLAMNTGTANGGDAGVAGGTVKFAVDVPNMAFPGQINFDRSGTGFLTINGHAYTVIRNVNELQALVPNVNGYYALGAEIDATATAGWNGGLGFGAVGPFAVFDGLGHTVSNLVINRPLQSDVGLFGVVTGATLRNIGLAGGAITGDIGVGAIAGRAEQATFHNILSSAAVSGYIAGGAFGDLSTSTVTDVHATGNVSGGVALSQRGGLIATSSGNALTRVSASGNVLGSAQQLGGLIGRSENDTVDGAAAHGDLPQAGAKSGGLIGEAFATTITNSQASGNVTSASASLDNFGGLVGLMHGGSITGSSASGNVSGRNNIGGLVGDNSGVLTNVSAAGNVSGDSRVGGLVGNNTAAINGAHVGTSSALVTVTATSDYAGGLVGYNDRAAITGTSADPVRVYANVTGDTAWVAGAVGFNHAANLTYVSAFGAATSTATVAGVSPGPGIEAPALGQFVGGLVGEQKGGTIDHGSASVDVQGRQYLGGLVGRLSLDAVANNVFNSSASGNVKVVVAGAGVGGSAGGLIGDARTYTTIGHVEASGIVDGGGRSLVGGLIGELGEGFLEFGIAHGAVSGSAQVGGLVGRSFALQISDSHAEGAVTATSPGLSQAGGLVGRMTSGGAVVRSYATGRVSGAGSQVGGLIGAAVADLTDVYATGIVSGTTDVGGLVGNNGFSTITGAYATGDVTASVSNAGGLIGSNDAVVTNAYATGNVSGVTNTGGLIGSNTGDVRRSYFDSGTVTGTGSNTGGLIGSNTSTSTLSNIHAGGVVNGAENTGGLIGFNAGSVSDAHATATVTGAAGTGGLIGVHQTSLLDPQTQTITRVYATGTVTGGGTVGGLIGDLNGPVTVSDSYATGAVSAAGQVGGLIGRSDGALVTRVYATGAVSGNTLVGGLVGVNNGTIQDAYATGELTATGTNPAVGGVVGRNDSQGSVLRVYAAGLIHNGTSIRAGETTGGIVGDYSVGTVSDSYWDGSVRADQRFDFGSSVVAGGSIAGRLGDISAKTQSSYIGWDFAGTWVIYEGFTRPLLRSFLTPFTVTASNAAKTYDAAAFSGGNGVTYSAAPDASKLLGTLGYGGTSQGATNAGTYNIRATGLYSHQQGYLINLVDGTLNVAQAPLTLSTTDVTKTYDGGTSAAGTAIITGGTLFGSDSISGGSFAFLNKNAGTGKSVTVSGVTVSDGNGGGNYAVTYVDNTTSTINRATVSASGIVANNKVYDGTLAATLDTSAAGTLVGAVLGDDVSLPVSGLTASFLDKNVGTGKTVNLAGAALAGADAGNYLLTAPSPVTADITPKALTVSGITASSKVYDGTDAVTVSTSGASYAGLLAGDAVLVNASGTFADKNVGNGKTVSLTSSYTGADVGNYAIVNQATASADITRAPLTVRANDITKTVGTTYSFDGTEFSATGLATGDSVGSVLLSSPGAAAGASLTGSPYAITASGAAGGTFSVSNYNVTYVEGSMTLSAAPPAPVPPALVPLPAPVPASVEISPSPAGNPDAMQAAIVSAQKLESRRGALGEGSSALNVTILGAGINLPRGVE